MTTSPRTGRFSAQRRLDYRRLVAVFDSCVTTGRVGGTVLAFLASLPPAVFAGVVT